MVKRVALVTGAGSGIGRASALSLAADGYAIGAFGLGGDELKNLVKKIEADDHKAVLLDADISNTHRCVRCSPPPGTLWSP